MIILNELIHPIFIKLSGLITAKRMISGYVLKPQNGVNFLLWATRPKITNILLG
jgi:hypothetical protein